MPEAILCIIPVNNFLKCTFTLSIVPFHFELNIVSVVMESHIQVACSFCFFLPAVKIKIISCVSLRPWVFLVIKKRIYIVRILTNLPFSMKKMLAKARKRPDRWSKTRGSWEMSLSSHKLLCRINKFLFMILFSRNLNFPWTSPSVRPFVLVKVQVFTNGFIFSIKSILLSFMSLHHTS